MGLFGIEERNKRSAIIKPRGVPLDLIRAQGCKACPLNNADCRSPKMQPSGSDKPLIYILGAGVSPRGDEVDQPLAGYDAKLIGAAIPRVLRNDLRFNNVVRTYTGLAPKPVFGFDDTPYDVAREPKFVEIEACRQSVIDDIERTKPVAIFGFGSIPLKWIAGETHANLWMGRKFAVRVGQHQCWYFPFMAPIDVLKNRKYEGRKPEIETVFERAIESACRQVWNNTLDDPHITSKEEAFAGVEIVTGEAGDLKRVEKWLDHCAASPTVGMDYETNALRPYNRDAKLLTGALSTKDGTLAFPFHHRENRWTAGERRKLMDMFGDFLDDPRPLKISHNLPFEMEWSAVWWGEDVLRAGQWADSLSQAYIIDEKQGMLALEVLTQQHFGFNIKELSKLDRVNLDNEPIEDVLIYNGGDAKWHRKLFLVQEPILDEIGMMDVYDAQVRRIPTLVLTSMHGVPLDQDQVTAYRKDYERQLAGIEKELADNPDVKAFALRYDKDFNPASSHDVAKWMRNNSDKVEKTDKAALNAISRPLAKLIIRHREVSKLLATYVLSVSPEHTNRLGETVPRSPHLYDDGLLHPIISTTKVSTWRTSSEAPNIQNWPKRGPSVIIRKQIAAVKDGYVIVAFDYAGIQARNVAMESRDKRLMQSFWDHYDIHTDFLERMIAIYPKMIKEGIDTMRADPGLQKAYRHIAKNKFVFPTFFGATPKRVSTDCEIPLTAGEEAQDEFFGLFPDIKDWQLSIQKSYERNGYVTGLTGHRRHAPISWNELINAPIQADEAHIVCTAMSALSELDFRKYQAMMEIHDDLTFLFPKKELDARADVVIREMVKPRFDWINVPLVVEMSVGDNWCDLKHVGDFENVGTTGYREINKKG